MKKDKLGVFSDSMPKYLTQEELTAFFAQIKTPRDLAMFNLCYKHGLRTSEIPMLTRESVDLKRGRIRVLRLKGSRSGEYQMFPDSIKLLKAYLDTRKDDHAALFLSQRDGKLAYRSIYDLYRKYSQSAGLPESKIHPHCLRHSIAVHLLDSGASLVFVQNHLGHSNIKSTMCYLALTDKTRDREFRSVLRSSEIVTL